MLLPILISRCLGAHYVYDMVITFWGSNWKPKHVTLGLLGVVDTT